MRRLAALLLTLALTGCKLDALFGHVDPPCADTTCLDVKVWNSYHQEWATQSSCWCGNTGRAIP